jgi:hypothetical protein
MLAFDPCPAPSDVLSEFPYLGGAVLQESAKQPSNQFSNAGGKSIAITTLRPGYSKVQKLILLRKNLPMAKYNRIVTLQFGAPIPK